MPRHDWFDDDTMSHDRDRDSGDFRRRERGPEHHESRDRGAMFGRGRSDDDRYMVRGRPIGGWGGLMGEDMSRDRDRYRDRDRERGMDRDRRGRRDEEQRFGSDDHNRGIPMDETERLIASNKVEGTPVYDRHGDKLGSIHNFMVEKREGRVVYAVLKHGGGFLGLGERYYPLEWNQLTYDTRLGGYHTRLNEDDLQSFGSFDAEGRWHSRSMSGRSMGGRSDRDRDLHREREMREPW